jgi:LPXTG-motif cell wall-anchored protein
MSEKLRKSETQMDEELAALTDRILSDQSGEESGVDQGPDALGATLFQLKSVVKDPPSESLVQRIEKQLVREWKKDGDLVRKEEPRWQKFLPGSPPRKSQQQPALAFVVAFVFLAIILIALLPINQLITSNIQATAGSANQNQILLFGLAVLVVIGLLLFGRKKP